MKVGLLGGSFDPVHNGHLTLAAQAKKQCKLSRVYFVLAPRSPFKTENPRTPVASRLAMLRIALRGKRGFEVGTWELRRRGLSYTVDTLRDYKKKRPHDELYFIVGSDALRGFGGWRRPEEILRLATLVVGRRPGARLTFPARSERRAVRLKGVFPVISSTTVRERLAAGRSPGTLVPPLVRRYIGKRKLYGPL